MLYQLSYARGVSFGFASAIGLGTLRDPPDTFHDQAQSIATSPRRGKTMGAAIRAASIQPHIHGFTRAPWLLLAR
jgi:hypothetical protein